MLKKFLVLITLFVSSLFANITKDDCIKKGEGFIFVQNECTNYKKFDGDGDSLNILIHGTWDEGSDTLARYSPFAEDITMMSDISTIAIALPGYSQSSSNKLLPLGSKEVKNLAATKEYIEFLVSLVEALKEKYSSSKINLIGHSAGCLMSSTLLGLKPNLVDNLVCVGGVYDIHQRSDDKNLISAIDVVDNISKNTKIVLIYGTEDDISTPQMTIDFYNLAKSKGLDVKLVEVKNGVHIDLDMTTESKNAIVELVEE
ncbi:alpha/beta hydrolase family protein [Aliarcobacter lanthieri]|uniref:alpha/beta hydrolase family protein n=1 Tax=Aliarcobacter lanthieri TaxID=1355374 RepID=UPI00047D9784|nr:alpha/beta fold hydrolase [Aliarcobacter lanthieri]QKF58713.1 putative esterase (alpha/beta hydrolase domain) [Aliarcobacter lanthieri]